MSLNSDTSRIQYNGNNSTVTAYAVPFLFFDNLDLRVVVTNAAGVDTSLTLGTGFTAIGAGNLSGGSVLTVAAVPNTSKVTIYREVSATQTTVYEENADFPAKSHERALDKLTMIVQQLGRKIRQGLRFRESDGELAEIPAIASTLIGLDAGKLPRAMTAAEVAVWLNVSQAFFGQGSVTFLNTADRNAAVPQFLGQVGVQVDTGAMYTGTALTAGSWGAPIAGIANGSIVTAMLANGVLSADVAGRAKMADAFVTLAKLASGIFTADMAGRAPFATGFVDSSLLAAGAAAGNLATGAILQSKVSLSTAASGFTAQIPNDATKPQITEGTQILSDSITPLSATSKILIRYTGMISGSALAGGVIALFRNSTADAIATAYTTLLGSDYAFMVSFEFEDSPASTSAQTYSIRIGPSAGTMYINRLPSASPFLGTLNQALVLQERKS